MKTILMAFLLALVSLPAFADKVVIQGSPVIVEQQGEYYVPSTTIATTPGGYYYVKMGDANRVCYREVNPALAKVDAGIFTFKLGADTVQMHCYDYNTEYFVVE